MAATDAGRVDWERRCYHRMELDGAVRRLSEEVAGWVAEVEAMAATAGAPADVEDASPGSGAIRVEECGAAVERAGRAVREVVDTGQPCQRLAGGEAAARGAVAHEAGAGCGFEVVWA